MALFIIEIALLIKISLVIYFNFKAAVVMYKSLQPKKKS